MIINQPQHDRLQAVAHDWVKCGAAPPEKSVRLGGVLYLSEAGWLLLNVPNAMVRGAFSALDEPGAELPLRDGRLNAHISVMRPDEIEEIGGPDKLLNDRGKVFHYTLGPVESVSPEGWPEMSKCWFIKVDSPELRQLRKSFGLPALPKMNEYDFHITIGVRRKKVLQENEVAKESQNVDGIEDLLQEARDGTNTEPTDSQIEAGNYKKGKVTIHGFTIAIENPRGSIRSGTGKDGTKWQNEMAHDYGYIHRSSSDADGDGLDVFIGPDLDSEKVFVINQVDPDSGGFDEHKCCFGFNSAEEAKQGYLDCYSDDWKGFGDMKEMSLDEFTEWADNGDTAKEAAAEEAKGIPSRKHYGDLSQVPVNKLLDFIMQQHDAERAGKHFDVRFGDPSGLHSWATRKELPGPGQRTALFQQPLHSHKYKDFEGTIPSGRYGAGTVKKHREGQMIITKMHPGMIHFTMASQKHPERFALIKPKQWGAKDWLLVNTTPTEQQPYEKVHYKKIPAEKVDSYLDQMQHGDSVEAKVDGASSLIKLLKDGVEVMSYRTSKQTGRPILYTEKLLGGGKEMKIPSHLVGSVLKGETYGVRPGKRRGSVLPGEEVIPPQELGGILNSALAKSLTDMQERKIKLKNMVYDIQQMGGEHIDWSKVPRLKRREMMQDVLQHLPPDIFHASEAATTPEAAKAMWAKIKGGRHPLTNEGVVIWPQSGKPMKGKLTEDADVHVSNVFPGEGKYQGSGAGGFEYALKPGGPVVGRVGTGFSDELRRAAHTNPEEYIGRVARIRSQQQLPSGAYRAPSLIALHEDIDGHKLSSVSANEDASLEVLRELGIVKEADTVVEDVQELIDGDSVFKDFDGGYGYVMWNPELGRLHLVTGDWYENEPIQEAIGLLEGIDGVDEVTADAESWPHDVAWTRIERGAAPTEIEKRSAHPLDLETIEAGVAEANAVLRQRKVQMARVLSQLNKARAFSDRGQYRQKQRLLRQLMHQAPEDWIIDQPEAYHPGITHTPTGFRIHTARSTIPAKVRATVPSAKPSPLPVVAPQIKQAAGSLIEQSLWRTPIQYNTGQNFLQNALQHLQSIRRNFRSNVGSRRYALNYTQAFDPIAKLQTFGKMMEGQDPVLSHPYDIFMDRFIS